MTLLTPQPTASQNSLAALPQSIRATVGKMRETRDRHQQVVITNLEEFLSTPVPEDTIIDFSIDEGVSVLDGDVHHWEIKPTEEMLAAYAASLHPQPACWFESHGHGLKAIFCGEKARTRALLAALTLPNSFKVELATHCRHPGSFSTDHRSSAGSVHVCHQTAMADIDLNCLGKPSVVAIDAYLNSAGFVRGKRYSHERCPIAGHLPSDAGNCVTVLDGGIFCHRCAAKGLVWGGAK